MLLVRDPSFEQISCVDGESHGKRDGEGTITAAAPLPDKLTCSITGTIE